MANKSYGLDGIDDAILLQAEDGITQSPSLGDSPTPQSPSPRRWNSSTGDRYTDGGVGLNSAEVSGTARATCCSPIWLPFIGMYRRTKCRLQIHDE